MHEQSPVTTGTTPPVSSIQDAWHALLQPLGRLLHQQQTRDSHRDDLYLVESLLHTLPLASGEFTVGQNRIRNARRYLESDETGAARYELQLLAGFLKGWLVGQQAVEPRRRMRRSQQGLSL